MVEYSLEIAEKILKRIATTSDGIAKICKEAEFPNQMTFYEWVAKDLDGLEARYTRAREQQMETYAQEMLDHATNCGVTAGEINRARLIIDTMKWIAAKLKPKKYGDNQQLNISGNVTHETLIIQRTPKTIEHQPEVKAMPMIEVDNIDNIK